jgi:exopolyphosphatase/guanosine-5'-triphosphate,3'-diphosphate pyrophosphatase
MNPFAVIDIGTNSIRLGVVQPEPDYAYSLLSQQKEVVRLGEGEFASNRLTDAAMDRGILVLTKFAQMAAAFGATETIVLATSALREAHNQSDFVERAAEEAGVEVHVISGAEEARLIYLGVLSGIDLGSRRAVVMDIGGGSTELAVGDAHSADVLESMKLGAIRMAGIFTEGETGPITAQLYRRMQEYVRGVSVLSAQRVRERGFDVMYGSSGTILNLAEMVSRRRPELAEGGKPYFVPRAELEIQAQLLCDMTLEERRRTPGINPERADIIVPGAAVLVTVMRELGADGLYTSDRALREGIVVDRLGRIAGNARTSPGDSIRNRSILQLARRCQFDEGHALTVSRLSCSLFDQLREVGLHRFGDAERELLHQAAMLHDVGGFISYTDHHRHGYYLVRNSPLLGFDATEINMLAAIVLHHRKSLPKRKEEALADLTRRQREVVTLLSIIVRLCEAMDRGHLGSVKEVRASIVEQGQTLDLALVPGPGADGEEPSDCQLELWGLENQRNAVRDVFGKRLSVRVLKPKSAIT